MNDAKLMIKGVEKAPGTKNANWDEWRARLLEEQGKIRENGKPKFFISSKLIEIDDEGNPYNFLVKELENLLWGETKPELNVGETVLGTATKTHNRCVELHHGDDQ